MAYADQQGMSTNRLIAIILVVLLHAGIGFALVSGLAYEAVKKMKEKMEVVEIAEEKPPEEEPPPPDEKPVEPPPVTAPPPPFTPPTRNTIVTPPSPPQPVIITPAPSRVVAPPATGVTCWDGSRADSQAACPPKPVEKDMSKSASPKGNPGSWANTSDYPSRALNQQREGTTGFRVSIGPDGKVTDCSITSSSGHADLDTATCSNVKRRARFTPALDKAGNPTSGSYSNRVTWRIPKD
jgi:periplasmic protein TonB